MQFKAITIAALILGGCSGQASNSDAPAPEAANAAASAAVDKPATESGWLIGVWAGDPGACGPFDQMKGDIFRFNTDGSFDGFNGNKGEWRLSGDTLTFSWKNYVSDLYVDMSPKQREAAQAGARIRRDPVKIMRVSNDEIMLSGASYHRCPKA